MCHWNSFFSFFLQASFLSSGFSIFFSFLFFSFLLFREEGKEETLSGIVSIRKGEKDGRESSPRVSKVVSVLHFRREMSGRRINRGNASSGYVTQTETSERRFPRVSLQFCFFFCKSSPISRWRSLLAERSNFRKILYKIISLTWR